MSTRKRKAIRKTAPILGAAAAAGLFSLNGNSNGGGYIGSASQSDRSV